MSSLLNSIWLWSYSILRSVVDSFFIPTEEPEEVDTGTELTKMIKPLPMMLIKLIRAFSILSESEDDAVVYWTNMITYQMHTNIFSYHLNPHGLFGVMERSLGLDHRDPYWSDRSTVSDFMCGKNIRGEWWFIFNVVDDTLEDVAEMRRKYDGRSDEEKTHVNDPKWGWIHEDDKIMYDDWARDHKNCMKPGVLLPPHLPHRPSFRKRELIFVFERDEPRDEWEHYFCQKAESDHADSMTDSC